MSGGGGGEKLVLLYICLLIDLEISKLMVSISTHRHPCASILTPISSVTICNC